MHRKTFDRIGAVLGWVAVIVQFVLMLQNRQAGVGETLLRFFSFFTILTNMLAAAYFTVRALDSRSWLTGPGAVTAITAFLLIVGLVYQVVLRGIWEPTGLQRIVDELLHSVSPLYLLVYWYCFSRREDYILRSILPWLVYPLVYFVWVILRGAASGFYPYPFVDVSALGYPRVGTNSLLLTAFALLLIGMLVGVGRWKSKPISRT